MRNLLRDILLYVIFLGYQDDLGMHHTTLMFIVTGRSFMFRGKFGVSCFEWPQNIYIRSFKWYQQRRIKKYDSDK